MKLNYNLLYNLNDKWIRENIFQKKYCYIILFTFYIKLILQNIYITMFNNEINLFSFEIVIFNFLDSLRLINLTNNIIIIIIFWLINLFSILVFLDKLFSILIFPKIFYKIVFILMNINCFIFSPFNFNILQFSIFKYNSLLSIFEKIIFIIFIIIFFIYFIISVLFNIYFISYNFFDNKFSFKSNYNINLFIELLNYYFLLGTFLIVNLKIEKNYFLLFLIPILILNIWLLLNNIFKLKIYVYKNINSFFIYFLMLDISMKINYFFINYGVIKNYFLSLLIIYFFIVIIYNNLKNYNFYYFFRIKKEENDLIFIKKELIFWKNITLNNNKINYFLAYFNNHRKNCNIIDCFCKKEKLFDHKKNIYYNFEYSSINEFIKLKSLISKNWSYYKLINFLNKNKNIIEIKILILEFIFKKFNNIYYPIYIINKIKKIFLNVNFEFRLYRLLNDIKINLNDELKFSKKFTGYEKIFDLEDNFNKLKKEIDIILQNNNSFWEEYDNNIQFIVSEWIKYFKIKIYGLKKCTILLEKLEPYKNKNYELKLFAVFFEKYFLHKKLHINFEDYLNSGKIIS